MARGIGRKRSESYGNPQGAIQNMEGVKSLFSGFNSGNQDFQHEGGLAGEKEPILSLDIEDEVLLGMTKRWVREYEEYYSEIKSRQEDNYDYWKGKQKGSVGVNTRGTDNIIFESTETMLPIITRQNPEGVVEADGTKDGDFLCEGTMKILSKKADETSLKSKIKSAARHWALYFIGCFKMGWDVKTQDMYFQVIDPLKLILDPKGYFDGGEFLGKYIGEKKTATAQELADEFPKFADDITALVGGDMGTPMNYIEWWTNEYTFWQYQTIILDKRANPYWNGETEKETMNAMGITGMESVKGINHFASPKMPYAFLSVFNTGKQPHDETSLIEQCKSLQDIVNKRLRQIDKNADETNNGWVFNKDFSADQAKEAVDSLKNGGAIIAQTENIAESVQRMAAPQLASFVYDDMQDKRSQIYNIMGVRGSTAQGVISEETVRGKIQLKGQDVDRMSLIVEQIEQFVDHLYNLAVQTIYVYYTEENAIRYLGEQDGAVYIQLLKRGPSRRLTVSVKEGSMIPKDPLTKRNEAMDLWNGKAISLESLYERLDDPDPKEQARKALQEQLDPASTLVELGGTPPMAMPQPGMPQPGIQEMQLPPTQPVNPGALPPL